MVWFSFTAPVRSAGNWKGAKMKFVLLVAGMIAALMFGLSAVAAPMGVDAKYMVPMPIAVQVDTVPAIGPCTPSAAQAVPLTTFDYMTPVGAAKLPCAMPGGASLGVGIRSNNSFYT